MNETYPCVIPSEPYLNLSLRGARQCNEANFWLRRLLHPFRTRNDITPQIILRHPLTGSLRRDRGMQDKGSE